MVESALRGVVREAIQEVIEEGELPGDHHFYITFMTDFTGVKIPAYLRDRYPGEMTIVLQYQFYDLDVNDERMSVTLSFNNVPERLEIPLAAITIFADPSVNFALQFQPVGDDGESEFPDGPDDDDTTPTGTDKKGGDKQSGEVVSLDKFRKK
ncbi:MAG: hypothetical protein DI551_11025 [Micavibrio aeruginosavorus]|uniref:Stringent starvation protein B n=1 Tax=Micavibrio aeruginosavorus TaxID=349221 RepID=A0A2W5PY70_9BACT|nr:MAG: hypothetical protein DI551_11025 [Micavibrio aeruginosavorus]